MANFKITATTTVAELKEQFHNEFGGILRIYQGRSEAPEERPWCRSVAKSVNWNVGQVAQSASSSRHSNRNLA